MSSKPDAAESRLLQEGSRSHTVIGVVEAGSTQTAGSAQSASAASIQPASDHLAAHATGPSRRLVIIWLVLSAILGLATLAEFAIMMRASTGYSGFWTVLLLWVAILAVTFGLCTACAIWMLKTGNNGSPTAASNIARQYALAMFTGWFDCLTVIVQGIFLSFILVMVCDINDPDIFSCNGMWVPVLLLVLVWSAISAHAYLCHSVCAGLRPASYCPLVFLKVLVTLAVLAEVIVIIIAGVRLN